METIMTVEEVGWTVLEGRGRNMDEVATETIAHHDVAFQEAMTRVMAMDEGDRATILAFAMLLASAAAETDLVRKAPDRCRATIAAAFAGFVFVDTIIKSV